MRFEWDPRKAAKNRQRHRVSFEEAETVFYDEQALVLEDPGPDDREERFVIIGMSSAIRVLVDLPLSEGRRRHSHHQRQEGGPGGIPGLLAEAYTMKKHYDFSKARKNPYAKLLKRQVTIRLDIPTIDYFKGVSAAQGIPYQTLINLYLRDCAESKRRLAWKETA
jgi:uncharacterized protein (DUF4415 family)